MRRKFSIAKQRQFLKAAREYVLDKGAVETPNSLYDHELNTIAGPLGITFSEGDALATIFCRFDNPTLAAEILGKHSLNPHSGKWNWHVGKDDDLNWTLNDFKEKINKLAST